jgi:hypothetical protein
MASFGDADRGVGRALGLVHLSFGLYFLVAHDLASRFLDSAFGPPRR